MTSLASPPPEISPPLISNLALTRQLFAEHDYSEALRTANLIPLSSPDAAEATQLMVGYYLWVGKFFKAWQLLEERLRLGVPESLALRVRRWQLGEFFIDRNLQEHANLPKQFEEKEMCAWMRWSQLLCCLYYQRSDGLKLLVGMAREPRYQARLLADPAIFLAWQSLIPQARQSLAWAGLLSKPAEALLAIDSPGEFRFGLANYHDLAPRFRGLFALNLLDDEVVLDPGSARQKPELHADFLEWFAERAAQTRTLLAELIPAQNEVLKSSMHETAAALVESGAPHLARQHLLQLAGMDFEKFREVACDPRLKLIHDVLEQITNLEETEPGISEQIRRIENLHSEPERFAEALDALPASVRSHEIVRPLRAFSAYLNGDPAAALQLLEGLESGYDSDLALLRAMARLSLEGFEGFWEELWDAPPTLAVHSTVEDKGYFRHVPGEVPALLELLGSLKEADPAKLQPRRNCFAVYLLINSTKSMDASHRVPRRKFLRKSWEDSAGAAIRTARGLTREVLLALSEFLYEPSGEEIKTWTRILGIEVQIIPDLRPHFLFENHIETVLHEVLKE